MPAAARGLVPSHDGTLRRSLVDVTRGLLGGGSPGDASGAVGGAPSDGRSGGTTERDEGNGMPENHHLRVVRPEESLPAAPPPAASLLDDPVAMEELVDEVVQRIEARVINELETARTAPQPGGVLMAELEKAFLQFEGRNGAKLPCLFNPEMITITKENDWIRSPETGGQGRPDADLQRGAVRDS